MYPNQLQMVRKGNRKREGLGRRNRNNQELPLELFKYSPDVPPGSHWTMKYALNTRRILFV